MSRSEERAAGWKGEDRKILTTTYVLIALNVLVFVPMVASGVSILSPTLAEAVAWGADYGPLTSGAGQWWRLLTACFVHFGIVHIALNMYVLYQIGPFVDRMFGRARYVFIYLFAGVGGSLVSVWIHPRSVGAGASGAIFGLYGAIFGFLAVHRVTLGPVATKNIARYAGMFVLFNLVYSMFSRTTDMSAHVGGLIAGFLFGLMLMRPVGSWSLPTAAV